jgi:nucleoside-diphosphate-sugar epimerase
MRICILGAGGFVGRNLARSFPESVALTRKDLNLLDSGAVTKYFSDHDYDVVIHCAVVGGSRLREDDYSILDKNLRMFFNVMNATRCKVYYFSSGAALRNFPNPPSDPYGFSKYVIEQYKCPRLQILRIWGCFGPDEPPTRFLATGKRDGHVTITLDQQFDFFHVHDVARVIEYLMDKPNVGYPLNMVYPGKKRFLSEIAQMAGFSMTVYGKKSEGYTGEYNLHMLTLPSLKTRIDEYLGNESVGIYSTVPY